MADTEYTIAARFQGDGELRNAANSFDGVRDAAKRSMSSIESAGRGGIRSWTELNSVISLAGQALGTLQNVAGNAMAALSEGAALSAARDKFDNLAASINTTGDALLGVMREATSGMMTDAELVASATDLMSLGLAKNEDQVKRLSSVIGTLGWDMQQVVLTMANNSTMRLDALGLSMESVTGRAKELKDAGMSMDEAFDLAVLEAGEAKIALLGNTADTTAGKIQQMGVMVENAGDQFKVAFAEGMAESIGAALESAEELEDAVSRVGKAAGSTAGVLSSTWTFALAEAAAAQELRIMGGDIDAVTEKMKELGLIRYRGDNVELAAQRYRILREEIERLQAAQTMINAPIDYMGQPTRPTKQGEIDARAAMSTETYWRALANVAEKNEWLARAADMARDAQRRAAAADSERAQSLADVAAKLELAATAQQTWADYVTGANARGGGNFAGFLDSIGDAREQGSTWGYDLMQSIYDAMRDGGAGVNPLSEFAVTVGASVDDIKASIAATQEQTIVDYLAQQAKDGKLAWEDYAATVENAIRILNGGMAIDLGPRAAPEMEDRGFREGFQEGLDPAALPEKHTIVIDADTKLAIAAVNEAKGLVEGFANPAEVYQAVMEMDITAVEAGTATATTLINGIPTEKTVTINFRETGGDVLSALRALGVIP